MKHPVQSQNVFFQLNVARTPASGTSSLASPFGPRVNSQECPALADFLGKYLSRPSLEVPTFRMEIVLQEGTHLEEAILAS